MHLFLYLFHSIIHISANQFRRSLSLSSTDPQTDGSLSSTDPPSIHILDKFHPHAFIPVFIPFQNLHIHKSIPSISLSLSSTDLQIYSIDPQIKKLRKTKNKEDDDGRKKKMVMVDQWWVICDSLIWGRLVIWGIWDFGVDL
ncbi:hypothetical protein Dsin_002441 [Dipteronia sinensis]|uniref:Uncharacterized protein n=1 Tax=Dipteronia sinensis TaxID=43782 RepID=A0AAE0EL89_9ROSI|nr:hypothetical protein Dsin_002441 [Dipteronia sinensis]